jgi:hypothetical protein
MQFWSVPLKPCIATLTIPTLDNDPAPCTHSDPTSRRTCDTSLRLCPWTHPDSLDTSRLKTSLLTNIWTMNHHPWLLNPLLGPNSLDARSNYTRMRCQQIRFYAETVLGTYVKSFIQMFIYQKILKFWPHSFVGFVSLLFVMLKQLDLKNLPVNCNCHS